MFRGASWRQSFLGGAVWCLLTVVFVFSVRAETAEEAGKRKHGEVVVSAQAAPQGPFLSDVEGTKINAGKKTSTAGLKEMPALTNNNYREALVKTPGLMLSEETTPLFSVGYRGLPPDRGQYMQILKDGIPITADMLGYPEAYYTPLLRTVDEIEFVRGGSALMYGPQPGGALNYVTKMPALDTAFRLYTENVFGTDHYFSTYEAMTGSVGPLGYLAYFHERQGDGFRRSNSDYEVISGGIKLTLNQTGDSRWVLNYDEYHEEHGEPGGLSLTSTTNPTYTQDRSFTTRMHDRFRLERYYGSLTYEKEFSEDTQFDFKVFGGHYRRWSKRQRTSGSAFGNLPSGANASTNDIQEQDFYNVGFEPRLRHDYELLGAKHTVSVGTLAFFSHSPREESRGTTPGADVGALRKHSDRDMWYLSAFIEHLTRIGKLSVTPGVRLEHVWQEIDEDVNLDKTSVPLAEETNFDFVPLFGLGLAYELYKDIEAYTNISQSYRPKVFADAVPLGTNQVVSGDLESGSGVQYDFGIRGRPAPFFSWDIDYFILKFKNQTGTVGSTIQNVGDSKSHGLEFSSELDVVKAFDFFNDSQHAERIGSLAPFIALTAMDAEFYAGPNASKAAQYAPHYNVRTGIQYRWRERVKVNMSGTFVGEHFADDSETANRFIPSYKVWDLTAEVTVARNVARLFDVGVLAGVNNLFDEEYYARITAAGIDPAYGRNWYTGIKVDVHNPFESRAAA